jgi:hypothetical protein
LNKEGGPSKARPFFSFFFLEMSQLLLAPASETTKQEYLASEDLLKKFELQNTKVPNVNAQIIGKFDLKKNPLEIPNEPQIFQKLKCPNIEINFDDSVIPAELLQEFKIEMPKFIVFYL